VLVEGQKGGNLGNVSRSPTYHLKILKLLIYLSPLITSESKRTKKAFVKQSISNLASRYQYFTIIYSHKKKISSQFHENKIILKNVSIKEKNIYYYRSYF
jgi:hypothetical protein